ncbi:right-handed parallel beta-helix repeat-containing protein [Methanolobus halotolerans]|uniref:Cytochrome C n=1 Tax=Methanolobus halotolerans TaxID=2052935 RepID=A0A4E0Q7E5_9EURY|nr:right-handed parallel beta-helix repeat-containing protein [Methanolobus halotolerans]TGC06944.1 cytochrome C [Methanolobus halotolerans]
MDVTRKTTSLFMVCLLLGLSLGTAISSAADTTASEETNYTIRISKDSGTTLVQTSEGAVVYNGNSDVGAIKAAVNAINQGTILIDSGTYMISSPVSLKSNIELVGNNAVLKGYKIFTISGATNVKISGFEFTGPDQLYGSVGSSSGLINIMNSKNCFIESNTFHNFRDYGVNVAVGSTSHSNEQITIRNNEFLDYGYAGVMIWKQSYHIYVEDNTFKNINTRKVNGNAYGVAVAKGSNSYKHPEHIYIRHNWIENNPVWEGIDSHGANHVYIQDNTVIDCKVPIAVSYQTNEGTYPLPVHDIVITGNYVKGNMDSPDKQHSGIHVLGARNYAQPYTNINVSGNTIMDVNSWLVSDDGAIVLRDVNGGIIDNNRIIGVGGTGINLLNADNLVVQNNDIQSLKQISGYTKGIEMSAVRKSFSTTIRDNKYGSSVDNHGFANSGYTYSATLVNEMQSKFGGSLSLNVLTDTTPATSTVDPPLTPPEPRAPGDADETVIEPISGDPGMTNSNISISRDADTTVVKTGKGTVIYSGTSDDAAVSTAVNAVEQGTVTFNEGTYSINSAVALKSDIELIGENATLQGYNIFQLRDVSNVSIHGFTFSGPDEEYTARASSTGLIDIRNSENCLIEDNVFTNFRDNGVNIIASSASDHNKEITIRNNEFLDFGYTGVMIGKQAKNIVVEDNTIRNIDINDLNVHSFGIAVAKASSTFQYSEYIYIRNNTIENNPGWQGIDSHGANYLFIEDNEVTDCKIPISVAHVNDDDRYPVPLHDLIVSGNQIKGNFSAEDEHSAITVSGGNNRADTVSKAYLRATVSGNNISDSNNWLSEETAVLLHNVPNAVVENNTVFEDDGSQTPEETADPIEDETETSLDEPPVAILGIVSVVSESGIEFDATGSLDDTGIASYSWDFDASNGIQEDATGERVSYIFPGTGRFMVTLTVTDTNGQQDTDTLNVVMN